MSLTSAELAEADRIMTAIEQGRDPMSIEASTYTQAAENHGNASGNEAQIEDLQSLFELAHSLLSPGQRAMFDESVEAKGVMEWDGEDE